MCLRLTEAIGHLDAYGLLEQASRQALESGADLASVLLQTPEVIAHLSAEEIHSALSLASYLSSSAAFVDRVLAKADTILSEDSLHALR